MQLPRVPTVRPILLLAALVALLFVAFMLAATGGRFAPAIVDLFVVCRYAQAMAEGHPFHYNVGEPASTGATSLLHTALLAVGHAAGLRGEGLVAWAVFLGIACYVASVWLAFRIGSRLASPREGALAAALVALGGPVVWGFLYGSDIALFMLLCLALLDRLLAEWDAPTAPGLALGGALLALARPEGLAMGLIVAAAWAARSPESRLRGRGLLVWAAPATGLLVLALQRGLTGQWLGTSVGDKSLFSNYAFPDAVALAVEYAVDVVRGLLLGFYPSQAPVGFARGWASLFFPPLGLLFVLLALVAARGEHRAPLRVWAAVLVLVSALVTPNVFLGVHFNRYLLWGVPSLLVLVAAGLGVGARLLAREDGVMEKRLFAAGATLFLALGALSTLRFGALYGDMTGEVQRRDVAAATWIEAHLPRGVAMANVATSVEYLTGHRTLNLHGVTSPAFFGNRTAEREAGVWESLGDLPEEDRPPFLITSASAQEGYPTLREIVVEPPVYAGSTLSDDILIFRTRWDLVGRARGLVSPEARGAVTGLREVDHLNVCDARDERAHGYRFESRLGGVPLWGTARIDTYTLPDGATEKVVDAGRLILGDESFEIAATPGRDLVAILRTTPSASAGVRRASGSTVTTLDLGIAEVALDVGGTRAAEASLPLRPGWNEVAVRVPGSAIAAERLRLRFHGRYASFYFWFFQ
jgi:hypothetical protein